ncbi:hypothetical protein [Clostridium novyi]|uniref:hypothetical protein n=1 Tax=Clostridium novyi TaxID=1542 RepID=UPI0026AD1008
MIIQMNINSEIQIDKLEDLYKLNLIMEENNFIHYIQNKKLNYPAEHYAEISALTFNKSSYEMMKKARQNLNLIGEVYKNE